MPLKRLLLPALLVMSAAEPPPGSRVTLTLKQAGQVALQRDTPYERLPAGTPLPPVAEPRPGIVYVDLGASRRRTSSPFCPGSPPPAESSSTCATARTSRTRSCRM
ncbi:MAG: hypothetical protein ACJ76J_27950 [Thermoanaerobaculia bacterium]